MQLDMVVNNYRDNLNSLYRHPDLILSVDRALRNMSSWVPTHTTLIPGPWMGPAWGTAQSSCEACLCSPCILAWYRHWESHFTKECRRKGLPASMPLPAIDVAMPSSMILRRIWSWNRYGVPTLVSWTCWVTQAAHSMPNHLAWWNTSMPCWLAPIT